MNNLYARSVFFVNDAERSLRFYTEQLGFSVDWTSPKEGPTFVFLVSLFGFELILNQIDERTQTRAGQGRVFIGLEDDQIEAFRKHVAAKGIPTERLHWGQPTLVVRDLDANELFFWDWPDNGMPALEPSGITEPMT